MKVLKKAVQTSVEPKSSMSFQNKVSTSESVTFSKIFTNRMTPEKRVRSLPLIKRFTGTCVVCKKIFTESYAERDPLISRMCSQSKEKPSVCRDCDESFVQTTGLKIHSIKHGDEELTNEDSSDGCVIIETGGNIDEKLTNTHISKSQNNIEKDEWVIIKFGESIDEVDTEKSFSIKLCNEECNEDSMVVQSGEEGMRTLSDLVVKEVNAEDMVTQRQDLTVKDIIQIESLSFDNGYDDSDSLGSLGSVSQASSSTATSQSHPEADGTWTVCTKRFSTADGRLDKWSVCTQDFSIRSNSSLVCHICKKYFTNDSDLKFHIMSHSQKTECPNVGRVETRIDKRGVEVHGSNTADREPNKCNICSKVFSDASALRIHSRTHSSTGSDNVGNVFSKKVPHKGLYHKNPIIQANEKLLSCSVCGTRFQHKQQLAKHTKTHLMLACKVCQRVFKSNAKLKKHMLHVCGKVCRDETDNMRPSTSHSSETKLKNTSDLGGYGKVRDIFVQKNSEKITEKSRDALKEPLALDHRKSFKTHSFAEGTSKDIKEEDIVIEDFPMVEDYYVTCVKEEIVESGCGFRSIAGLESGVKKGKCSKR
ncbi:RB-associated KRAB zinc finger protein-like [Palaemon carinicauda]|uniref:RB-associated KRAB zinc finger protein-like n=1 Tax=Palaemon carinicauda TaxID=392227 RepID=UPI0035B59EA3